MAVPEPAGPAASVPGSAAQRAVRTVKPGSVVAAFAVCAAALAALFVVGRQRMPAGSIAAPDPLPSRWRLVARGTGKAVQRSHVLHVTGPWWRVRYRVTPRPGIEERYFSVRVHRLDGKEFYAVADVATQPSGAFVFHIPGDVLVFVYSHHWYEIDVDDEAR